MNSDYPSHTQEEKPEVVYPGILHVVAVMLITFAFALVVGFIAMLWGGKTGLFLSEIVIIIPALLFVIIARAPILKIFRLKIPGGSIILNSIFLAIGVFVLADQLDRIIQTFFPMPQTMINAMEEMMTFRTIFDGIIIIVSGVILAGLCEEMLFRGIFQGTLETRWNPYGAVVISACLFAMVHLLPWTMVQIFLMGLVLGYITLKINSIIPAAIVHGGNNLFSIIMINLGEEKYGWYTTGVLVRPVILVAALFFLFIGLRAFVVTKPSRQIS